MKNERLRPYLIRLAVIFSISLIIVIAFNEISYALQKDRHDRAPKTIQLVIPAGTATSVEAGKDPVELPEEMVFVVGDILEVKNQDSVSHQLGPIWVPPDTTGSLTMENIGKLAYSCSFSTTQYLGMDIREPTTITTRLLALSFAAPTMTALLFIYSLAALPIKSPEEKEREQEAP
jgi:hypothetical protein